MLPSQHSFSIRLCIFIVIAIPTLELGMLELGMELGMKFGMLELGMELGMLELGMLPSQHSFSIRLCFFIASANGMLPTGQHEAVQCPQHRLCAPHHRCLRVARHALLGPHRTVGAPYGPQ